MLVIIGLICVVIVEDVVVEGFLESLVRFLFLVFLLEFKLIY